LPFGGQNLIEAAACACPVIVGPHTFNFLQATDDAVTAGAARRIGDAAGLAAAIAHALADPGELAEMRAAAAVFAAVHRGATERTVGLIRSVLTVQRQGREGH
jgi:3-deoxy-D-manno-octulosonic-acid transferase